MKKNTRSIGIRLLTGGLGVLLIGLLFTRFVGPGTTKLPQSEKINLALRRTAHYLLLATGDSTSRILPVQRPNDRTFRIQLNRAFAYDQLPALLQQSLQVHQITDSYDVAVLDCLTGEVQLGYTVQDLLNKRSLPCTGRAMPSGCYTLQVTFAPLESTSQSGNSAWLLVVGGLLIGLGYLVWPRPTPSPDVSPNPVLLDMSEPQNPVSTAERLCFGQTTFEVTRQVLTVGAIQHELTFREAKLLRLFGTHINQVLERDVILKQVWQDEGVTVSRSVDVFVSRLRKLLHDDPSVRIVAIHGVGYRLEVRENG